MPPTRTPAPAARTGGATKSTKTASPKTAKAPAKKAVRGAKVAKNAKSAKATKAARAPARKIIVRNSAIHGRGVYALRPLRKGERVIEYTGELISWKEADRRPPSDPNDPNHTFLFSLDDGKHVIDASVGGNDARWINHSCAPNCETEEAQDGRVFIEALRRIEPGEELSYDYCLIIDGKITKKVRRAYRCLCGAADCRGTMLAERKKKKKKK